MPAFVYSETLRDEEWISNSVVPGPKMFNVSTKLATQLPTSGLAALPLHAIVAEQLYAQKSDDSNGLTFLENVFESLRNQGEIPHRTAGTNFTVERRPRFSQNQSKIETVRTQ